MAWLTALFAALSIAQAQTSPETVIYSFAVNPRGANPLAPLTRDASGNLFGTTSQGGQQNLGLVFKLDSSGKQTVLHSFLGGTDGANPYSGLLRTSNGVLYGTTYAGGTSNAGIIYKVEPSGQESVIYTFTGFGDGG
ncbi:MAG TPA: choice-of-anchor tandem repeat GloVer-containing protein, partial [Terriglobales bacterium]|nr:choice-of-anchor tandem repeat GloVer-containing protein [Terriglobales bacterium]